MAEITQQEVADFRNLVSLAETGELQAAVEKVGPYKVNPYYYDDPRMANAVGFFMNTVAPLARQHSEDGDRTFSVNEAVNAASPSGRIIPVSNSVELAYRAGFLRKVGDNETSFITAAYKPTPTGFEIATTDMFITKNTNPEYRGIMTGIAAGSVGAVALFTQIDAEPLVKATIVGLTYGVLSAPTSRLGFKYGKLKAGRAAHQFYQSKLTPPQS